MLPEHKEVFFRVADFLHCWIGLREPNKLSDKWIGRAGYIPKGENCKAKTADNRHFDFAGLVINPILCPEAFQGSTLPDAVGKWKKFAPGNHLPPGFSCSQTGKEKGILKFRDRAIHADFDLMAICSADKNGKMVFTTSEEENKLFFHVQRHLNLRLGSPLIQHGPEFAWKGGVGAAASEYVLFFGPKKGFQQTRSSMPKLEGTMH